MRFRLSPLVLAFCALAIALAQDRSDSSKVLALEKERNTAYKGGDVARMNTLLVDDFIITIEGGGTFSKSGYIAFNGNSTVQVDVSEMSDIKVRVHGSTAAVTGAYHEKGTAQGKSYVSRPFYRCVDESGGAMATPRLTVQYSCQAVATTFVLISAVGGG